MNKPAMVLGTICMGLAIACIGLGVTSLRARQTAEQERATTAALQARLFELTDTHSYAAPGPQARLGIQHQRVLPRRPSSASVADHVRTVQWRQRQLLQNPDYRLRLRDQQLRGLEWQYRDLGPALGLSAAQVQEVLSVLADQQVNAFDQPVRDDARAMAQFERNARQLEQRLANVLGTALGSDGFERWTQFETTLEVRFDLERLRDRFVAADADLSGEPLERTVRALAAVADHIEPPALPDLDGKRPLAERKRLLETWIQQQQQIDALKRQAIEPFLSDAQLTIYEHVAQDNRSAYDVARLAVEHAGTPGSETADPSRLPQPLFSRSLSGSLHLVIADLAVDRSCIYAPGANCKDAKLAETAR